jgi:hypothetical protein
MYKPKMKPYKDRDDLERLESCWRKFNGLMENSEWSAAITRAATAAEIAANIAVRHELQKQRKLEPEFVDSLLFWANGLSGKLKNLLRPLHLTEERLETFNSLQKKADRINKQRNQVVHSGNFMNPDEAEEIKTLSKEFVEGLVGIYHEGFKLKNEPSQAERSENS